MKNNYLRSFRLSAERLDINKARRERIAKLGYNQDSILDMTLKIRIDEMSNRKKTIYIEDIYKKKACVGWFENSWIL